MHIAGTKKAKAEERQDKERTDMGVKNRVKEYFEKNFTGVLHTTLNPEGPGVIRIHLIPPKMEDGEPVGSIAILNGQDILPVNTTWTIILAEFIKEVNKYEGKPLSNENVDKIVEQTCKNVKKIFHLVSKKLIRRDLYNIMKSFMQVARGLWVDEDVEYLSIGDYAPYMTAPHRMDLMVSSMTVDGKWNCNQKCLHCYAAGQTHAEEAELSTEEWKKIIDKCREANIPQVTFTGGEPTMRGDLTELVEYAAWFVTRLNTNGVALTKELCEALYKASLDSMQITFYSNNPEIHNKLVGEERYEDTVRGIENALAAGINVSINTPLCTLNRDYLETLKFLYEKGVRYVTCSGLITTGNAALSESEATQLTTDEIKEILREAVVYCYAHEMEISFTSPGWVDAEFCKENVINVPSCGACLSNMAITPSGNVVPCQSWLSDEPLGNILKDDWKDIWESEKCKEHREFSARLTGTCPLRKHSRGTSPEGGCI